MKFKALLLSLFLFIPVKVVASEKPIVTSEAVRRITINGLAKYSLVYCEQRDENISHKKADRIAFDEAYNYMSLAAYQYYMGLEAILYKENIPLMLETMDKMAEKRCPEYF